MADNPAHLRIRSDYSLFGGYQSHELEALEEVAKGAPAGPMLELGVFRGDSARRLARWASAERPLYLYDNMMRPTASRDIWPVGAHIIHCSKLPTLDRLGLLHEDADHVFNTLLRHLQLYGTKVVPGGLICLHDWSSPHCPDVQPAWAAWDGSEDFEWLTLVSSLAVFKRKS